MAIPVFADPSESKLLTAYEVAERLRVHYWTVYHWASAGRLPCVRLAKRSLRFRESDINKMLHLHTTGKL